MSHTKGPWVPIDVSETTGQKEFWIVFDHFSSIASVRHGADDPEYGGDTALVANANLMALAPEMLEELEFLIEECLETKDRQYADGTTYEVEVIYATESTVERIKKLIAKARGKT